MAYNRDDDRKPSFPLGRLSFEGNMVDDPKDIGKDRPVAAFKVAANSRNYKEYEGALFISVTCTGSTAERVLAEGRKGVRVHVEGNLYKDEPWENRDGDLVEAFSLSADSVAESWRFSDRDSSGSGSRRRRDDDEPRGRSGRSSRRDEGEGEGDEPRGRSGRSSRRSEEADEEPRGRSGRSSRRDEGEGEGDESRSSRRSSRRDEGEGDEPRGRSRRSSRRGVSDEGDSED